MVKTKGGIPASFQAMEELALRSHIESAAAGKTNLTDDQLVDLIRSAFPLFYSGGDRKLLTERVAKITQLPCRRGGAIDETTPVTKKRRTIDETRNVSSQVEVLSSPVSAYSLDADDLELLQSENVGDHRKEMSKNGNDGKRGVNGINRPISRALKGSDKIGDVRREMNKGCVRDLRGNDGKRDKDKDWWKFIGRGEGRRDMNKNGDGGWRDASGNNRPMFKDLYGMGWAKRDLVREVIRPMHQLKLLHHLGVEPTSRILLHGPPGCGKTMLARAIANEAGVPFYEISVANLVSGVLVAPEENIRELFSKAYTRAPSVVFIDEIDAVTSKTESLPKDIEPRIVKQLMACMDEAYRLIEPVIHDAGSESSNSRHDYVLVIGATNRLHAVGPALRQLFDRVLVIGATNRLHAVGPALRQLFDREIVIGVPDETARFYILSILLRNFEVADGFDIQEISRCTVGFVGRDLVALAKKAGICAVNRILDKRYLDQHNEQTVMVRLKDNYRQPFANEEMEDLGITMEDIVEAGKMVQPSSAIEAFSTIPNAKWDDVGGLQLLKMEFERHIIKRIKFPEVYKDLGVDLTNNFFLYGPSGCGKTLIVEALANEAGATFIHIKSSELKEYGDQSGLVVRTIFSYARTYSPCILFFDELEAITPCDDRRQCLAFNELAQVLMTDAEKRTSYLIGASNRPTTAILSLFRPGGRKGDKLLYVPLPSPEERGAILKALARNKPIDVNVDLMALGKDASCENLSGADLSALMKEAAKAAIDRPTLHERVPWTIKDADFRTALKKIVPSVSSTVLLQSKMCKDFTAMMQR